MSLQSSLCYKVWSPDTSPASGDPLLTLHNEADVCSFVQSILSGDSIFAGKPFAMRAFDEETKVAEGTYCLFLEERPRLYTPYKSGMLAGHNSSCDIISAIIIDAIAMLTKEKNQEQQT